MDVMDGFLVTEILNFNISLKLPGQIDRFDSRLAIGKSRSFNYFLGTRAHHLAQCVNGHLDYNVVGDGFA